MRALPGAAEIAARNKAQASTIDSPPKVETMSSAPDEKEESIDTAKAVPKHLSSIDHLSAPASRLQSGTATPAEPATEEATETTASATGTHGGSEIKEIPAEEVKKVESETDVPDEDEDEDESAAKGVEGLQVGEGTKVQEQSAEEGEDAGKSVED